MIKILHRRSRIIALFFISLFSFQLIPPTAVYALTSGPSQPEVQAFQPAGTSDMVDLFSGDFSYNIPLFELPGPNGGYPFNLGYQSGIGMDQEATWVGLGWSLNPGAINRQMRGLPDEFKGDVIHTKMSIAPNITIGVGAGGTLEVFGGEKGSKGTKEKSPGSLSVGFSIYNNTYKGIGFSIDGSIGYQKTQGSMAGTGVNLGLKLDSQEGANVSPSLTLGTKVGEFGLGAGYNSRSGLSDVSFTHDIQRLEKYKVKDSKGNVKEKSRGTSLSSSASLSLAHPGYTPQITMPMKSGNVAATFKYGGAFWGVFGSGYITGFYNESRLKNDKKRVPAKAYGYLNYQYAKGESALLDFNREKDGIVSNETPNLGIPSLSYDIYSVVGQGISAMYRPMRNDYGSVYDQKSVSESKGGAAGVDLGPALHLGVNLSVNHSKSVSGVWDNPLYKTMKFDSADIGSLYQPWYFKVHGEPAVESAAIIDGLGGEKAVRPQLKTPPRANPEITSLIESTSRPSNWSGSVPQVLKERRPRNQVIQPITNEQLLNGTEEILSQFKVTYLDSMGAEKPYQRKWKKHHTAGFTAFTPEGLQYVYAIPAYNLKQVDVAFSTTSKVNNRASVGNREGDGDPDYDDDATDKYLKSVEIPEFAHSYLLTSILGPDYVDVTGDGVSPDDLGYWVKFTYQNTADDKAPYKWRDPFTEAHYEEGWKSDPRDDKGSFVYGEKEIWYLAKAETKSHIAVFNTIKRDDGFGVKQKLQKAKSRGKQLRALKEIKLFTRSAGEANPIKTVTLDYDYSLCEKTENGTNDGGKLTLKKVWFGYGTSKRGELNPYTFSYQLDDPDYDNNSYDRWGNYKPHPSGDVLYNKDFPYVEQDPAKKNEIDKNAAAWSLTEIQLPSGGKIIVDYESDDYAYVQHKKAMQMVELVDPYKTGSQISTSTDFMLKDDGKVRFKLESLIVDNGNIKQSEEVLKYLDEKRKQLYFKIKVYLRNPNEKNAEQYQEFISGYADIDFRTNTMTLEKDGSGKFAYGVFYLKKEKDFHPFSMRVWQHLRTNQPEVANAGKLKQTNNTKDKIKQIKGLGGIVGDIKKMFTGYYKYCKNRNWGRKVVVGKSWVRLNSPDLIKYGGGLRVRQITMMDQWSQNKEGIYGQVYEYTTEENKKIISSGVAAYEPLAGADENALRYAKKYTQSVPLRSDNNLFFEYPINETYYPGPGVGYRKVSVLSLAAASLAGKEVKNIKFKDNGQEVELFPKGSGASYGTTGMTIHEFYTAKDFPVITDETEKENKPYKLPIFIPFIGNINVVKLSASQGYSIVTNDMHGKQMKVSNYRQDKSGKIEPEPISWVKYNYASQQKFYEQERVFTLNNRFKKNADETLSLITPNDSPSIPKFTLGQENEFFADFREFEDKAWTGGVRLNTEVLYVVIGAITVPVPWPSISKNTSQLRSAVTNKVIFKSGILESTEAYDGGSLVKTNNLKWDKLTGATVLTSVNNNFEAPIFSYSIPAYSQYQGMGAAYQNIGFTFTISGIQKDVYKNTLYQFSTPSGNELFPGDEILLYAKSGKLADPLAKVVYTGETNGRNVLYSPAALPATEYRGMIIRSGYRNQLSVQAGSITALEDPSKKGDPVMFTKTITIPQ